MGLRIGLGTLERERLLVMTELKMRFLENPHLIVAAQETSALACESKNRSLLQHV